MFVTRADSTDVGSASFHPLVRTTNNFASANAMVQVVQHYDEARSVAGNNPIIVLVASKYLHDMKIFNKITAIPWNVIADQIVKGVGFPRAVKEELCGLVKTIPMIQHKKLLHECM